MLALGTMLVGFGSALFLVSTLSAAMGKAKSDPTELALGTWGAVQAFSACSAIALGGALKDGVQALAHQGTFGPNLAVPVTGYSSVYSLEILLLLATLIAAVPLFRRQS